MSQNRMPSEIWGRESCVDALRLVEECAGLQPSHPATVLLNFGKAVEDQQLYMIQDLFCSAKEC